MVEKEYLELDYNLFEKIFMEYYKKLRWYAYKKFRDLDLADDIVQNVMMEIWKSTKNESKVYSLEGWIKTILKFRCIDAYNRKKNIKEIYSDEILENLCEDKIEMFDKAELNEALNKLQEPDRKFVIYNLVYGYKLIEIAKYFGCSSKTITRKIRKSLEILRKELQ